MSTKCRYIENDKIKLLLKTEICKFRPPFKWTS